MGRQAVLSILEAQFPTAMNSNSSGLAQAAGTPVFVKEGAGLLKVLFQPWKSSRNCYSQGEKKKEKKATSLGVLLSWAAS